jgi:putative phage-type endonuclease
VPSIPVADDSHWRSLRLQHVGASDVAALFGLSPWLTRWQLYHLKKGNLPEAFEADHMTQGKFFEPAIAAYAQDKFKIQLRKVRRYLSSDTVPGLGASLDYEEFGGGALIPTEIKWSLYGDGWDWEGDELTAIPDYYMMQVQHQLAASPGAPHGQLIAFTGGDLKRMVIPRSDRLIGAIEAAVRQFWADVAAGNEPPVDFKVDSDAVTRLAYVSKLRSLTLTPDHADVFERWEKAAADEADAKERKEAARAEVLKAVVDAGEGPDTGLKVVCGNWRVSISKVADSLGKEITPDMVGTRVGARKGHLRAQLKKEG